METVNVIGLVLMGALVIAAVAFQVAMMAGLNSVSKDIREMDIKKIWRVFLFLIFIVFVFPATDFLAVAYVNAVHPFIPSFRTGLATIGIWRELLGWWTLLFYFIIMSAGVFLRIKLQPKNEWKVF